MIGYALNINIKIYEAYILTIKVKTYKKIDNYMYYSESYNIIKIEDVYQNEIDLKNIVIQNKCIYYIDKNIVFDELYDFYIRIEKKPNLNISKYITLYSPKRGYFMNNFSIEGEYIMYKEDELMSKTNYINGIKNGEFTKYKNNKIKNKGFYLNGKLNGEHIINRDNGDIIIQNFKDGVLDGKSMIISSNGEVVKERIYEDGFYTYDNIKIKVLDDNSAIIINIDTNIETRLEKYKWIEYDYYI